MCRVMVGDESDNDALCDKGGGREMNEGLRFRTEGRDLGCVVMGVGDL